VRASRLEWQGARTNYFAVKIYEKLPVADAKTIRPISFLSLSYKLRSVYALQASSAYEIGPFP